MRAILKIFFQLQKHLNFFDSKNKIENQLGFFENLENFPKKKHLGFHFFLAGIFLDINVDVKFCQLSISDVFRAIPALHR